MSAHESKEAREAREKAYQKAFQSDRLLRRRFS